MITSDVVVDLAGWYAPTGATLSPIAPRRLIDTRTGTGLGIGTVAAGSTTAFDMAGALGGRVSGVAINITATGADGAGFVTAFACGQARPVASNVNHRAAQSVSNMAMVALAADGRVCFYSHARTHLVVDVFATIGSDGPPDATVTIRSPVRIVDTRIGLGASPSSAIGPLPAMREFVVPIDVSLADSGRAGSTVAGLALLNVTAVHPSADGWLAVRPCGTTLPEISNLNVEAGSITPGHVVAAVGTSGSVCIVSMVSTDVVVDLLGWSRAAPLSTSARPPARGLRRLFTPLAVGMNRCSTPPVHRRSSVTPPVTLGLHPMATPWRWPVPAPAPARCPARA